MLLPSRRAAKTAFETGEQTVRFLPPGCAKKIDGDNFRESALQARELGVDLRLRLGAPLSSGGKPPGQATGFLGNLCVVGLPRLVKQRLDLLIRQAFDEPRLADRAVAAPLDDFPKHPLEVLTGLLALGEDVDGVLDGDRSQSLQAAPDLDAQVIRLGGNLMDEHRPAAAGFFGHRGSV